ncbi:MAG TPA: TIGR04076 family protein [Vicinamibacterales bacterium]|nr:TIGR04076 family protein [Vicinamibacterales bacterium]
MATPGSTRDDDVFELFDLRVDVIADERPMVCSHRVGHAFDVHGENLVFAEGAAFSMYALAALMPLLPAKQRDTHPNDWMTTDADIACPDPNCGARFRIARTARRRFRHQDVTVVPLPPRDGR